MNNFTGIGNLTKDPEYKEFERSSKCRFTIAINDSYGEKQDVDYIDVVVWNKLAQNCSKFLHKGSKCAVSGKLKIDDYEKKDGSKGKWTYINAFSVEFLDSKPVDTFDKFAASEGTPW